MPEAIQQRDAVRLKSAEESLTRRRRLVLTVSAAGFLLASSVAFYLIQSWTRGGNAAQAAAAVVNFVSRGEVEQARSYLDNLRKADPGLLEYPLLLEAQQRLQVLRDKEDERILEFDKLMRAAEMADVANLNPRELESACKLACAETETKAIDDLVMRRSANLETQRRKHEVDIAPSITSLSQRIADIQQKVESDSFEKTEDQEFLGAIADAQRVLGDLAPKLPYVGTELQSLAHVLGKKLETVRDRLDHRRKQIHLENEITSAVAFSAAERTEKVLKFVSALDACIKSLPNDPRSQAFKRTRGELTLWYGVEEWNKTVAGWKRELDGLTSAEAKVLRQQCTRILAQHPAFPGTAEVTRYKQHAEAIARRAPNDESPTIKLRRLLSDILVAHVWMVTVKTDPGINEKTITNAFTRLRNLKKRTAAFFSSVASSPSKAIRFRAQSTRTRSLM